MRKINLIFSFILLSCLSIQTSYSFLGDLMTNFYFVNNMIAKVKDMEKEANGEKGEEFKGDVFGDRTSAILDGLVAKTNDITNKLNTLNSRMSEKMNQLEKLIQDIGDDSKKAALMNDFSKSVDRINYAYGKLVQFSNDKRISGERIDQFIKDNIDSQGSDGIEGHLENIFSVIVSEYNPDNLLNMLERIEEKKNAHSPCGRTTPNVILWEFYLTVSGVELLGLQTLLTGYLLKKSRNSNETGNSQTNTAEDEFVRNEQLRRMIGYVNKFSPALKRLSRKFRNCDPAPGQDIRDKTFYEMWGAYQWIILSAYNLWRKNDDCYKWKCHNYNGDTPQNNRCWTGSSSSTSWKEDGTPEDFSLCSSPRACRGTLANCEETRQYTSCMLPNSTRRYDWIEWAHEDTGKQFYGQKNDCPGGYSSTREYFTDSAWFRCAYCLCECYDNAPDSVSVHTISLLPARADTADNRVVIGVRLRLSENIIHVQIKEGKIAPGFSIIGNRKKWIKVPKIKEEFDADRYSEKAKKNVDYTVFDGTQGINFDEIQLPFPRLITAVKLGVAEYDGDLPTRIRIEVESMEYDYETGKLNPETAEWTKPDVNKHTTRYWPYRHLPTDRKNHTRVTPMGDDAYMKIDKSYADTDAVQTVLPFFDAQDFEAIPNVPLSGIGIHHRGIYKPSDDDYSGFVGFHGYTYDNGEFIRQTYNAYAKAYGIKVPDEKDDPKKSKEDDEYTEEGGEEDDY